MFTITPEELERAFGEFDRRNLRAINYSHDPKIVGVMGRYTGEDPRLSAGCETGIKLGLLIASARQESEKKK